MSLNIFKSAKVLALATVVVGLAIVANPSQAEAKPRKPKPIPVPAPVVPAPVVPPPFATIWDYSVAGTNNGTGGSDYDYRGIAIRESGNEIYVAINTGMGLQGSQWKNETINHGDLFLNFSGKNFKEASDSSQLFAVKFATAGSQSGVSEVGLYKNVKAKSVTAQNYGWGNTTSWSNAVGGNNSYGDLKSNNAYFGDQTGSGKILNSIDTGTKVGGLLMMSTKELAAQGLNFTPQRGANGEKANAAVTLGFRFAKTADFNAGSFIANMFAECGNDGLAIKSNLTRGYKVPEPTAMAGMAVVGGMSLLRRLRRRA